MEEAGISDLLRSDRRFLESAKRDQDPLYATYVLILVLGLRKG